ncbi:GNAT family N-acetyltransferase [Xanthobacter sediminis]|uniref:GNAT family N-acetyltransferase n=1 Tax=Xanthobacter sediminis TaxID=3119926 RepID=UPI0037298468
MTEARVRPLTAGEVEIALEWAAREGWNPGLADAAAFHAQDEGGFLGLFLAGELAATLSAVRYAGGFGFMGFYICRPDLRGRGLGLALWWAGLARLDGLTVGLDGVVAQQANYAACGFVLAHRNIRYGGRARPVGADDPRIHDPRIMAPGPDLLARVAACDEAHFGFSRPAFLARWLHPPGGVARVLVEDGAVTGYGVARRCREGFKIGPLFAAAPGDARALLTALAPVAGAEPLYLDVPEPNAEARGLAEAAGLAPVFETARMYRGPAPRLPLARIFGITSFELG